MPGVSGVSVVTNSRVFFYTRGCGCIEHPAFPTPSVSGGYFLHQPGRFAPREGGGVFGDLKSQHSPLSSSAKADDPVFQSNRIRSEKPRRTGYPPARV